MTRCPHFEISYPFGIGKISRKIHKKKWPTTPGSQRWWIIVTSSAKQEKREPETPTRRGDTDPPGNDGKNIRPIRKEARKTHRCKEGRSYHANPKPSFLGVITHRLGVWNLYFSWFWGSKGIFLWRDTILCNMVLNFIASPKKTKVISCHLVGSWFRLPAGSALKKKRLYMALPYDRKECQENILC